MRREEKWSFWPLFHQPTLDAIASPFVVLLAQQILVAASLLFSPPVVMRQPDSESYESLAATNLWSREGLSARRTLGYPLLLQVVQRVSPELRVLPLAHFAFLAAATCVFYGGLRKFGLAPWWSCAAASAVLYAGAFTRFESAQLLTDYTGSACGVACAGFLLGTVPDKTGWRDWLGLTASTVAAYHVRPSQLALLVSLPLLGVLLRCLPARPEQFQTAWWRKAGLWWLAMWTSLIGYCALRAVLVGHLGLVSFGGLIGIGISGQFVTPEDVPRLSPEVRPLAEAILSRRRAEKPTLPVSKEAAGTEATWQSPRMGRRSVNRQTIEDQFNIFVWQIAVPAAEREFPEQPVVQNARLTRLSKELLRLHRVEHANWLFKAYRAAWCNSVSSAGAGGELLGVCGIFCGGAAYLSRRRRTAARQPLLGERFAELAPVLEVLGLLAIVHFALAMLLVVLVNPPLERYVRHAGLFWITLDVVAAGAGALLLWDEVRAVCRARRGEGRA